MLDSLLPHYFSVAGDSTNADESVGRSLFGQQQSYAWSRDSVYLSINQSLVEIEQMRWI